MAAMMMLCGCLRDGAGDDDERARRRRPYRSLDGSIISASTMGGGGGRPRVRSTPEAGPVRVVCDSEAFDSLVVGGAANSGRVLATAEEKLFHEAGIWFARSGEWLVTSGRLDPGPHVRISAVDLEGRVRDVSAPLVADGLVMANGGTPDGRGGALLCSQGLRETAGAVFRVAPDFSRAECLVGGSLNHAKADFLNSPNDVVLHTPTGCIILTDPTYGHEQGFRDGPHNSLDALWCAQPREDDCSSYDIYLLDETFVKPNGCLLSQDMKTLFVSDTGYFNGKGEADPDRPRHIYAYDVVFWTTPKKKTAASSFSLPMMPQSSEKKTPQKLRLVNRREFASLDDGEGIPDGLKVDSLGNLYAGTALGVYVYAPSGKLIGRLLTSDAKTGEPIACANLCFGGPEGKVLLMLCETQAIAIDMNIHCAL